MSTPHRSHHPFRTDRRGMVLTVVVIIVTTLLATGLLVSNRLIRTFTETRNLYLTMPAFYAAESGAERGLAVVKRGRADTTAELCTGDAYGCTQDTDVLRVVEDLAVLPVGSGTLTIPGTSYAIDPDATTSLEGPYRTALKENETLTFGFFPPVRPGSFEGGGADPFVTQLKLQKTGGANVNPGTWLEVRWVGFEPVVEGYIPTAFEINENGQVALVGPTQLTGGSPTVILSRPSGSNCTGSVCSYNLVQIRPLYGDLDGLTVTPMSSSFQAAGTANRVTVASVGSVQRGSEQATALVTVSTAWRVPASGFFTYTLFSEGDLTK